MSFFLFCSEYVQQMESIITCVFFSVELFGALRGRLYDSNKNLIMATLASISGLAYAMGPAVEKSSKVHWIYISSSI